MSAKPGNISGLLNINKPKGITSHDVVARVRRLAQQHKAGHAGTLDPMATGVLLICLGQATRLIEYLMASRKQYRATIRFGLTTDTLDADGNLIAEKDTSGLTETQLKEILPTFLGEIEQVPPIFSALKQGGQPLYKLARAGQIVEVEPRPVTIDSLTWVSWEPPDLTLEVMCSPGTYIRSLARDLGEVVDTGAHLISLSRIASGPWSLANAVPLDVLEHEAAKDKSAWQKYLHPPDRAISHLPQVTLDDDTTRLVKQGQQIQIDTPQVRATLAERNETELVRVYAPTGKFLAILTRVDPDDKLWQPKKVFDL